jgi:hypothetical protein
MTTAKYIEDLFLELGTYMKTGGVIALQDDYRIVHSFEDAIHLRKGFTKKQADYAIKMLKKYSNVFVDDISEYINNPLWRLPFRVVDYTKKISIEKTETGQKVLHIKFPFALKDIYQKEFAGPANKLPSHWDTDLKVQVADLYSINLIQLHEFGKKHQFEFSEDFLEAVSLTEEYWNHEQMYVPRSTLSDNVTLINASESAVNFFNENKTGNAVKDLFLARSMGYPVLIDQPTSAVDKLLASKETHFWIKDTSAAISLLNNIDSWPVIIILDRSSDVVDWSHKLIEEYKKQKLSTDHIKICFRFKNDDPKNKDFNAWVKDNNLGGEMKNGKVFICQHKPPKWMLDDKFDVKIVVSNTLYPHTNNTSTSIIQAHHTVLYVGNIRPSPYKEKKIVEL